ncbi:MAG: AAA family ATPase [Moorea sp. SIO4G2]|nr:AAA family ATPase [Moorena sp. SIO4G2]
MTKKVISIFNNKGGVGKTNIIWNLGIALADKAKKVLFIDFDPQCNLSIAVIGYEEFEKCLENDESFPFGKTIRSYIQPYIQSLENPKVFLKRPKYKNLYCENIHIIHGDFWLNTFADYLNVGSDVNGGNGIHRFLVIESLIKKIEEEKNVNYDYVLIDLAPSFNTLVRLALYCSDYFLVPCTADLFSAYCVGLIGEVLPSFIDDWIQGKRKYLKSNQYDKLVSNKGKPKFGGWIFNGFDTRVKKGAIDKIAADKAQFNKVIDSVENNLLPKLKSDIDDYKCVPSFVPIEPVAEIEDLNTIAPDSIVQNTPIQYLSQEKPTREIQAGSWSQGQKNLMSRMSDQYNSLAEYIIKNFEC